MNCGMTSLRIARINSWLATLVVAAGSTLDAVESSPSPLSPEEAAQGWIALFDGESTFGWAINGEAKVISGVLHLGGSQQTSAVTTSRFPAVDHHVDLEVTGAEATLHLAGIPGKVQRLAPGTVVREQIPGPTQPGSARQPVRIQVAAGGTVRVRKLAVRPRVAQPLFNGKNLDGWQIDRSDPKRSQARFTVTANGELHVLGGPGDIRTEAQFADFLLQAEVRTAGPTVNSGLFFRCVPGQIQNGYECQIQNGYKNGNRREPLDYGTGAIYRRAAARKVVANDNDWFTLTVLADGPHLATWVNGYPVVDWTDERPRDENPRKGLRTDPGHLSIQGHSPPMSADVLFRNIRITPFTSKEK
jgi:hypothetical protein